MLNAIGIVVFLGVSIVTAIRFAVVADDQDFYRMVGKKEYLIVLGMLFVCVSYIVVDLLNH